MVPYLTTALTGPLLELEKRLLDAQHTDRGDHRGAEGVGAANREAPT
jgi:hypothetical protein